MLANGPEVVLAVLDDCLTNGGLECRHFGQCRHPADNGVDYDWFIRVACPDGTPASAEDVRQALDGLVGIDPDTNSSAPTASETQRLREVRAEIRLERERARRERIDFQTERAELLARITLLLNDLSRTREDLQQAHGRTEAAPPDPRGWRSSASRHKRSRVNWSTPETNSRLLRRYYIEPRKGRSPRRNRDSVHRPHHRAGRARSSARAAARRVRATADCSCRFPGRPRHARSVPSRHAGPPLSPLVIDAGSVAYPRERSCRASTRAPPPPPLRDRPSKPSQQEGPLLQGVARISLLDGPVRRRETILQAFGQSVHGRAVQQKGAT